MQHTETTYDGKQKKYTYQAGEQQSPDTQRGVCNQFFSVERSDSNIRQSAALCSTASTPEEMPKILQLAIYK